MNHAREIQRSGTAHGRLWGHCRGTPAVLSLAAAVLVAGCDIFDNLISVEPISQVAADQLDNPANAGKMVNGVLGEFECAFGDYVLTAGTLGYEFVGSVERQEELRNFNADSNGDWATSQCGDPFYSLYTPLQTARWYSEDALDRLEGFTDAEVAGRTQLIAQVAAYSGYAYTLLGESMCTLVLDTGAELNTAQIFESAEEKFSQAIAAAQSADDDDILNMARVGRARARLNLARWGGAIQDAGKLAEAASDAAAVSEDYVRWATYEDGNPRRFNGVNYGITWGAAFTGVQEPFWDLQTPDGDPDPRVDVSNPTNRFGLDGVTPIYNANKYPAFSSAMPVATWVEAQLIVAEAELQAGNRRTAEAIVNNLHTRAGLPPVSSVSSDQDMLEWIIYERSAELFAESQHLGDIRRYGLDLYPQSGTPHRGGPLYGNAECFPVPNSERNNNPNL